MLFIFSHWLSVSLLIILNGIIAHEAAKKAAASFSGMLLDAEAGRKDKRSLYSRCVQTVRQAVHEYERSGKRSHIYKNAKDRMKKAGYRGEYAALWYLAIKFIVPPVLFIMALITNYPDVYKPVFLSISTLAIIEFVVAARKKEMNQKLQRYIYKIYKYLHNQISSGVKVTDAIRSVYEIVDDRELREIMMQMAASYELSLDIDKALMEFSSYFDAQEAQTLCVALKQGVLTGDNQELLARQEDIMFKKYFNYIQVETESCRTRCVIAVAMFMAVVVIMISVPLFNDATEALSRIFIN